MSGTYFRASNLTVQLDLSHKSAGAKTSYSVSTPSYECEITVLFVPILEIARAMHTYRNSSLEYNPRSYLDLEGKSVNDSIRETLLKPDSNEFALLNNGLTILSDETNLNERIGQHNKAQLRLLNPQIINGGQTAYTLSRVFHEDPVTAPVRFSGKEVLVKVITLTAKEPLIDNSIERHRLIDEISVATADRLASESVHVRLQKIIFDRFGLLYERKRGEFSDGEFAGYIDRTQILERNLFVRIFLAAQGKLKLAVRRKIFVNHNLSEQELCDPESLDRFYQGYQVFVKRAPMKNGNLKRVLAKVYIGVSQTVVESCSVEQRVANIDQAWVARRHAKYSKRVIDRETGESREVLAKTVG